MSFIVRFRVEYAFREIYLRANLVAYLCLLCYDRLRLKVCICRYQYARHRSEAHGPMVPVPKIITCSSPEAYMELHKSKHTTYAVSPSSCGEYVHVPTYSAGWQASLASGRVSVCGEPIVSISAYKSEIIDFTWLEVRTNYLPRPRRKSLAVSKYDPLTCLGFWKKFAEQSGVHGSMSVHSRMSHILGRGVAISLGIGTRDLAYCVVSVSSRDQSLLYLVLT